MRVSLAATQMQRGVRMMLAQQQLTLRQAALEDAAQLAVVTLQLAVRRFAAKRLVGQRRWERSCAEESAAATCLQRAVKAGLRRRDRLQEERAVVVLQCCVRSFAARRVARWQSSNVKAESSVASRRRYAAMMVQRCWRRCGLNTKKPIRLIDEEQEIETGELGVEPTDGEIGRGGVARWCWGVLGCGLCRTMCMVGRYALAIVDLRGAGCVRRAADDACVLQTMFTSCTMGLQGTRQQR